MIITAPDGAKKFKKKSRIQETKHLSTDADSSMIPQQGGPRIHQNPIFLEQKNHLKRKNSKMSRNMPKFAIRSSTRGL